MVQVYLVLFLSQPWNQSFLQGSLVSFSRGWYLETKIWAVEVFIAIGVMLFPSSLSVDEAREYVYPKPHLQTLTSPGPQLFSLFCLGTHNLFWATVTYSLPPHTDAIFPPLGLQHITRVVDMTPYSAQILTSRAV